MESAPENPPRNTLGPGLDEAKLAEAVRRSGYPLQTLVARDLRHSFSVEEEWSFIDGDTKALRSLDIRADRYLYRDAGDINARVRPHLTLLIECKQSEMPYIFFLTPNDTWLPNFPAVSGLFTNEIELKTDDDPSTWTFSIISALSLADEDFRRGPDEVCRSFSKAIRKGSGLELSGTEPFQGLILPLVKALQYHKIQVAPPKTAHYFDAYLSVAVAVVDAPMVGVQVDDAEQKLIAVPWVRVLRQEAVEADHEFSRQQTYVVDVVHRDFLNTYIESHLEPFALKFAEQALVHGTELATGKGFAKGLGNSGRRDSIELKPRR